MESLISRSRAPFAEDWRMTMSEHTEDIDPIIDGNDEADATQKNRPNIPYNLLSVPPANTMGGIWERRRTCALMHASNYTCIEFYKPISRAFKVDRAQQGGVPIEKDS